MTDLSYDKFTDRSLEEVLSRLEAALKERGFGILANLPVHKILKEKIGAEIPPLLILEVCSPKHAHHALSVDRDVALMLPCKIVLSSEKGRTRIALQRPTTVLGKLFPREDLNSLGTEVETALRAAVDASA